MSKWQRSRGGILVLDSRLCSANVGPAFFGGGGGAFSGPLDAYTTNLWTAVSVRRLLASWTGACFTARDTTDGDLLDIGFDSTGAIDASALSAFLGAHNATARALINQQGTGARGFDNSTTTQQPAAATAGVFDGKFAFDGSNDYMPTGTNSGTPSAFTVFIRGLLRATTTQILLEHSTNYNSNNAAIAYYDAGAMSIGVHDTAPGGYSRSDFTGDYVNNNVQCWRFDRSQVTSANMTKLFINGTAETRNGNGDSGTLPDSTFGASAWYLGARGGTVAAALDVHTLLIYEAALSDADVSAISTILAALP